jgi:hypothetical protein
MKSKNLAKNFLDKRLYTRLRLLTVLSIALTAATIFEVVVNGLNNLLAVEGIIIGLLVGIVVSRMFSLSWDDETNQVISNMDWIGAIIFLFYLIFMIGRTFLVGYWTSGTTYFGIIISITAGVMIGRIIGTRHSISKIRKDVESLRKSLLKF